MFLCHFYQFKSYLLFIGEINDSMVYMEWFQLNAVMVYISFLSTPWRERTEGADANVLELMVCDGLVSCFF